MSEKPVLVAQISDLHIKAPGSLAYGRVDTAQALQRCVAMLNALQPAPDFVVISGDLADTPTPEEYGHLARLLQPLKLPYAAVPGNHDSRELMRAALPRAPYAFPSGPLNQKIEIGPLDLLLLDSSVHGKPHGELGQPTLQWLDTMLAESRDRPALVFLHHPPFIAGIWHMGEKLKALSARIISGSRARSVVELEMGEGKNREVRRLFESKGLTVKKLQRTQIGKIKLGELKPGKWRTLSETEVKTLISDL